MSSADYSAAEAYDALADRYDEQMARNPVAQYMRREVQSHLARLYKPGNRVVDFTAGTGQDACFLAGRGVSVTALDASPGMIAELARAVSNAGLSVEFRVLTADRLGQLAGAGFDGAFSTFAGLNTVEDMPALARNLHACVRPRGQVLLHALNRFCLWESIARRSRGARAARRVMVGGRPVLHQFYDPVELWRDAFQPYFDLRLMHGLSVVAWPRLVSRFPPARETLFSIDRLVGDWFPTAGDMFLLVMERRDG